MDRRKKIIRRAVAVMALVTMAFVCVALGVITRTLRPKTGELTGGSGPTGIIQAVQQLGEIALNPKQGFPGVDRMTILCMGIDDNWTDKDEVYTKQARTDTLFVLTLDLVNKTVTMLSIPRDTYAHIAGTEHSFKINSAYQTGGPQRAIATVAELLNVHADHYMVLNIDATRKMVDALGGVDVDVEHEMHYHDKWGHLSIDLMPGQQHLNGDQAVGFARYRHPDVGAKPSPEDGDDRRMARQHVLMRAMVARAKTFANVTQAPQLIDVGMSAIQTDLTRTQMFDIAAIFRGIQPDSIRSATLPGEDFRGDGGAWFFRLYPDKAKAYVDWLVNGDDTASRHLVTVVVRNATHVNGLAQCALGRLRDAGYTDIRINSVRLARDTGAAPDAAETPSAPPPASGQPVTDVLDTGVVNPTAPKDITDLLHIPSPHLARVPVKPNHLGWTPPVSVTITLGDDYATLAKASGELQASLDGANVGTRAASQGKRI